VSWIPAVAHLEHHVVHLLKVNSRGRRVEEVREQTKSNKDAIRAEKRSERLGKEEERRSTDINARNLLLGLCQERARRRDQSRTTITGNLKIGMQQVSARRYPDFEPVPAIYRSVRALSAAAIPLRGGYEDVKIRSADLGHKSCEKSTFALEDFRSLSQFDHVLYVGFTSSY